MPKFSEPPSVEILQDIPPDIRAVPTGTWLWRVYFREPPGRSDWNGFRSFGPARFARFDHHVPPPRRQERGILYAATEIATCIAEVFQASRVIDRADRHPWLVGLLTAIELSLLDLSGPWPTAAGASMAINSGPRPRAQRWSRAIYEAYPQVHGLWYPSSMNANLPAIALYERAAPALPESPAFHRPLTDPTLTDTLEALAQRFRYDLG